MTRDVDMLQCELDHAVDEIVDLKEQNKALKRQLAYFAYHIKAAQGINEMLLASQKKGEKS